MPHSEYEGYENCFYQPVAAVDRGNSPRGFLRYESDCEKYYQGLHLLSLTQQREVAARRRQVAEAERRARRARETREEELRTQATWWRQLDGPSFERELATFLARKGFSVKHTGQSGDDGVDLILEAFSKKIIVQCKAHAANVGPAPVRELYGCLFHTRADEAWLVATSNFSSSAFEFARGKPLRLLTIPEALDMKSLPTT